MAGISIRLKNIFEKQSVFISLYGAAYSVVFTLGPLLLVMACILAMYHILGFHDLDFMERELFSATMLYIFVFSILSTSPFNIIFSKYTADQIYLEELANVRSAIMVGLTMNMTFASVIATPFYGWLFFVGEIPAYYLFTSYLCFLALVLVLAVMTYNTVLKRYKSIAKSFLYGMTLALMSSFVFKKVMGVSVSHSMLLGFLLGFLLIATTEFIKVLRYFPEDNFNYKGPLNYFKRYWKLGVANFLYTLGLFAHNFVFWTVPWNLVVANSYICNPPYDQAATLAMFTNISASMFFIINTEMRFGDRYAEFTNAILGAKLDHIEITKKRMFRELSFQILTLTQTQFVVAVVFFMIAVIVLPLIGLGGVIMQIYPLLAVGYFCSFLMYSGMLFLQYFNDLDGLLWCTSIFAGLSVVGSLYSSQFSFIWSGSGFTLAGFIAFTYIYFRLSWLEKNLDSHVLCRGRILKRGRGKKPSPEVYISSNEGG